MKQTRQRKVATPMQSAAHPEPRPVRIEKPVYGGAFLARVERKAVFVPLTLPGELARVCTVEDRRSYANAEVEEILEPAEERTVPRCAHFGTCGGCHYQHAEYDLQLRMKETILRETLERGGVHAPESIHILAAEPWGYRNRIRLAMDADGNFGYRARRSHSIVPITECPIAAPVLLRAARAFVALARSANLRCAEIELFCNATETQLLATVVVRQGSSATLEALAAQWAQQVPELKGVQFVRPERSSSAASVIVQWGNAALDYETASSTYRVEHGAFFQVNRWLIGKLVEAVTAGLTGEAAWDLYAGVGLFARPLARSFKRVTAVESAPAATAALAHNLLATGSKAVTAQTLAFLRMHAHERPNAIVVDPPRAGLGADVTTVLGKIAAPGLVYVSCDPATLARDLQSLLISGYIIESVMLADLFPHTFHIESIVRLRRG
jgi:23S rRNA (uracil1939-C5)-methyltransferase